MHAALKFIWKGKDKYSLVNQKEEAEQLLVICMPFDFFMYLCIYFIFFNVL